MLTEIAIIFVLTVMNGLLAMSELAVVSSRPVRLRLMAEQGSRGARTALALAEDPGRFLSTVQIGITAIGVLSGAFSGATLGERLSLWLGTQGVGDALADGIGVGVAVALVTYLSLIVGELVPKRIALSAPERWAIRVAPAMRALSTVGAPLVWLLDRSGHAVLKLIGQDRASDDAISEAEVTSTIDAAESAGVLERDERAMIARVMRLADRTARGLMTPRREVETVDLSEPRDEILAQLRATRRSRLPAHAGDPDAILGVVVVKDLLDALLEAPNVELTALVQPAPAVLEATAALDALRAIREAPIPMALVVDEYGHLEGVITAGDVLEAITGAFREEADEEPAYVQRSDGSWLVSGWMPADEVRAEIGAPVRADEGYVTVAGFVLAELGRLPEVGESFEKDGWSFEVVDLDGRRIDKLLVARRAG